MSIFIRLALSAALLALLDNTAFATDVGVVGLFPGKAVLVVNNGAPKTYSVGSTIGSGIKLISVSDASVVIDNQGKRQNIALGEYINRSASNDIPSVTLQADSRGHFMAQVQVNGVTVSMLVDTGATMISLPASEAMRMNIDYKKGQIGYTNTANGRATVYRVKLNTVKLGDIELNQIDALVQENGLSSSLLGMSFLNRTEMHRQGEQMTLTKRF
jgi:aspartyl protease family protein